MHNNTILVVDDQQEILNMMRRLFQREYNVLTSLSGTSALTLLKENRVSLILCDQRMPEMDGVTFLKKAMALQPEALRIMVTGYADIDASIAAVNKAEIYQYISKPFEPEALRLVVRSAIEKYNMAVQNHALKEQLIATNKKLEIENKQLKNDIAQQLEMGNFIANSPAMHRLFKLIKKVVQTPTTVLLLGETGTGKEMLAKMIHYNSDRSTRPFIAQNCGAIPDTLLQSELFGHVKGAFTGAVNDKKGLFELANNGTVFLDEIGDTSAALQVGLLRFLQEGEIKPVGSNETIKLNVRVIAATNRDLLQDVKDNKFREDLYYRLNVFPLNIPPLHQRREDIPELIRFFVKKYADRIAKKIPSIDQEVLTALSTSEFPGNVRELENEIERIVTLTDENQPITTEYLSERFFETKHNRAALLSFTELKPAIAHLEQTLITDALQKTKGNILKAAEILGISRVGLHKMLKRHEIDNQQFKTRTSEN